MKDGKVNPWMDYKPGPARTHGIKRSDPTYWKVYDQQRKAYKAQWKRDKLARS